MILTRDQKKANTYHLSEVQAKLAPTSPFSCHEEEEEEEEEEEGRKTALDSPPFLPAGNCSFSQTFFFSFFFFETVRQPKLAAKSQLKERR